MTIDFLLFASPQGLTHLGKGTLTLCPYHSDRQLMSQVAVAGLLTVLVSFLDVKNSQFIFHLLCLPTIHLTLSITVLLFNAVFSSDSTVLKCPLLFTVCITVILGKSHYILYGLVAAMQPRMLVTFDEELRPLPVSVRVGQVKPRIRKSKHWSVCENAAIFVY